MDCTKTLWFAAALVCAGCPGDGDDDDTGAGTTEGGPASADDGSTSADDGATTGSATSEGSTGGGSTSGGTEAETGHHDESTGHHETEGHDTETHGSSGSETGHGVCDVIGEGCHDNKTKEGIACHLLGHDGDEMVCMEAFEMCAEICGL